MMRAWRRTSWRPTGRRPGGVARTTALRTPCPVSSSATCVSPEWPPDSTRRSLIVHHPRRAAAACATRSANVASTVTGALMGLEHLLEDAERCERRREPDVDHEHHERLANAIGLHAVLERA